MNIEVAPKETEIQDTWANAQMYCLFLNVDDKNDWRLPTLDELDYIYHSENDFKKHWYWSSTEYNGNYAWSQDFSNGDQGSYGYKNFASYYVRAVRDINGFKNNRYYVRAVRAIK